jgi:glycerophosphoryl diester phosphodiesterase
VVLSGSREKIPTLSEVLTLIDGRVPLLIEIKDQDGQMGPDVGPLEASVASEIRGYTGPLAVMSFNPHSVAAFKDIAPGVPIGLTTSGFDPKDWAGLPEDICAKLRGFPDFGRLGASFISHDARDLTSPDVHALRDKGIPVLCWTIRSSEQEKRARIYADNITFEGYLPDAPKP